MPTYGYECLSCDNQFETFQSIKDDALTTCGECGGTLRKRIYPVGISFKGSGFYVNDYAAKPSGSDSGSSEPAKTEAKADTAEKKPEPKSDSTPEAKPEPKAEAKPAAPAAAPTAAS